MLPPQFYFGFPDLPHIQRGYTNQSVTKKEQRWQNKDNGKHTYHRASCHQHTHGADDVDIGVKCDTKGRSKQAHAGYNDGRNGRGKRRPHSLFLLRASDSLGFIAGGRQDCVIHGRAKLDGADTDRRDERQTLSQIMGQSQVDPPQL